MISWKVCGVAITKLWKIYYEKWKKEVGGANDEDNVHAPLILYIYIYW